MKTKLLTTLAVASLSLGSAQAASYLLGENDPGAANGVSLNATTTGLGGPDLSLMSTGGTYSSNAAAGSTLSAQFNGSAIYGGAGGMLAAVPDLNNFSMGFDAFPTASPSFHIALTLGSNFSGDGAGGNLFIYHAGGTWHVHSNGIGDFDSGLAANLNSWNSISYARVGGVSTLTVNGIPAAVNPAIFPASFKDAMSIGGSRNNSGAGFEGGFIGNIDNVFVGTPVPEPSAALLGALASLALIRRRR